LIYTCYFLKSPVVQQCSTTDRWLLAAAGSINKAKYGKNQLKQLIKVGSGWEPPWAPEKRTAAKAKRKPKRHTTSGRKRKTALFLEENMSIHI